MEKTAKYLFGQTGLTVSGAVIFFFGVFLISYLWSAKGKAVQTGITHLPKAGRLACE